MASDQELLNLDRDLPVTPEDVVALRRLKAERPSWLLLSSKELLELSRQLHALIPPGRLRSRPIANDHWQPFSLD